MRRVLFLLLPVLCSAADGPPTVDTLVAAARALPAEFAADVSIRLAGTPGLETPVRIALLAEAFERAGGAQQPIKRRATPYRLEGPAGFLNRAYAQELDALSLRLRAIDALLPLDSPRAEALFLKLPPLPLAAPSCDEFLVADVSRFYEVLGRVAGRTADAPKLLERYTRITSPAQVGPVAHLLAVAGLTGEPFRRLAAAFAKDLAAIQGDDRTFTQYRTAGVQVLELAKELDRRKLPSKPLRESYRLYLVNHLTGVRCADDDIMEGTKQTFGLAAGTYVGRETVNLTQFFNDSIRVAPLQPIGPGEMQPARQEGAALGLRWCEEAGCREIAEQILAVTFGPGGAPYLPADKQKPEWREKLRKLLAAMEAWKPAAGDEARQFREKAGAYADTAGLVVAGEDRATVLSALLAFVARNPFQAESRMEWFLAVNGLIARAAMDPAGLAGLAAEMRRSEDPVISLYAWLEQVAPRPAVEMLPLL